MKKRRAARVTSCSGRLRLRRQELHADPVLCKPDDPAVPQSAVALRHQLEPLPDRGCIRDLQRGAVQGQIHDSASNARAVTRNVGEVVGFFAMVAAALFHDRLQTSFGLWCCIDCFTAHPEGEQLRRDRSVGDVRESSAERCHAGAIADANPSQCLNFRVRPASSHGCPSREWSKQSIMLPLTEVFLQPAHLS